jgi:hypothetical protein
MQKTKSQSFSAIRTRSVDVLALIATPSEREFQTLQGQSAARAESSGRRLYV